MMDLLTKTGPISGAVWARGMQGLQLEADGFSSLQAVRNKAGVSPNPPLHTLCCSINTSWDVEQKKKRRDLAETISLELSWSFTEQLS